MNLYLLRHGLAVEPDERSFSKDSERPLTAKGETKLVQITSAMVALDLTFDAILSSPYIRARQTAEIVADAFRARAKIKFTETLTPSGNPRKLIELIHHLGCQDPLLVSHEPFLSEFISFLVAGSSGFPVTMKKSGFCKLSLETLRYGPCATLEWLLTPKQLLLMA